LIFTPAQASLVLAGKKTHDRRPVKPGRNCAYKKGRTYAVQQGRGRPGIGHVRVLKVSRATLTELTQRDAIAEGFRTRAEFFDHWADLHFLGQRLSLWPARVWVVEFELAGAMPPRAPRWLAHGSGTTSRRRSIDQEVPLEDPVFRSDILRVEGGDVVGGSARVSRVSPLAPSAMQELEDDLRAELRQFRGREPEDVHALAPRQGSPGEVRQRRRRMGLRMVDGLEPRSEADAQALLAYMLVQGCSVRDLARAMDWSRGKAHNILRTHIDQDRQVAA
jgi:hypothetical protein